MSGAECTDTSGAGAQAGVGPLGPGELRIRRRALGLTQAELADQLTVSANTVARWERGELRVGQPRLVARTLTRLERNMPAESGTAHRGERTRTGRARTTLKPLPGGVPDQPRHNLPAELTSFVGREHELTRLVERLDTARLVTLVGPGGVGKTRLALQVANRIFRSHSRDAWFVELAPLADSAMVAPAVAATLGVRERGRAPLIEVLADALREQQLLLVLDNCEHVLDGCATLAHTLLRHCRQLVILATSREPIRVLGEVRWRVSPLSLEPATGDGSPVSDAVQLFIERAGEVSPDRNLSRQTHAEVARICARLDGLPLAIELAAARTGSIPVRALLRQLQSPDGGLPVLVDGPRDAPARQRTMRATIGWSYDLLTADEQALFRRMAPFHGCSTEAVEAVCIGSTGGPGQISISIPQLDVTASSSLASLVTRNLLQVDEDAEGQPWYSMLETVREFALDRLEASPESAMLWRRQAWYYLRLLEQWDTEPRSMPQQALLDRIERDHANIRAAMDWCQAHGYAEASLRLGVGLFWFWTVRGYMTEGRARLEAMLARFPLHAMTGARARLHARALDAIGYMATAQGDLTSATESELQALRIFDDLGDAESLLAVLDVLAVIARKQNDLEAASRYVERIVDSLRHPSSCGADPRALALALANLGTLAHERGDATAAAEYFDEALRVIESTGDLLGTGLVKLNIAILAQERGDLARAQELARLALELLEREHDRRGVALALAHLGGMAVGRRDFGTAHEDLVRSLQLNSELGDRHGLAFVFDRFAVFASATGQPERALRLAGAAITLREQSGTLPIAVEQHDIDQQIERARNALGRMADTVLESGRALSIPAATDEALAIVAQRPVDLDLPLSAREREVATLVGYGYTNRRIAATLVISDATVATHVRHMLSKLRLGSRSQLAVWATRHGLLESLRQL
jgi:non-specific serine/threonine protein kinase